MALRDFSQRKSTCDFPLFSRFFWFFFSALLVFAAAAAGCLCVEGVVFVSFACLFLSPSLLDDDGVCNCLNKSAVTIIVVVFVFFSGFVSMPLLVVILWS